jgi:hypothetical protein
LLCLIAILTYLLIPELVISILFGSKYVQVSNILVYIGVAYSLLSISNLIILHKLAHEKIKLPIFMLTFIILQILLLSLFRANLKSFSIALLISDLMMLGGCFFLNKK